MWEVSEGKEGKEGGKVILILSLFKSFMFYHNHSKYLVCTYFPQLPDLVRMSQGWMRCSCC